MYIDVDTHYWPLKSDERVNHPAKGHVEIKGENGTYWRDGKVVISFQRGRWDLSKRYEYMDQDGFDVQVLIPENRPLVYELDPDLGKELARSYNEAVAEDLRGHDRFIGCSWVYLPDVDEAVREVRRAAEDLGLWCVKIMGRFGNLTLADESLYPFYEECARLDIPLLVHPAPFLFADGVPHPALTGAQMLPKGSGFPLGLGLPFTYMSTIGDLIFGGLMERFPTLRFGFFEGGVGWVPFLMNRLDNNVSRGQADEPSPKIGKPPEDLARMPSEYFDRLYVAAVSWENYLGSIAELWGPKQRIILGSDFNHGDNIATWPNTVGPVKKMAGLPPADRERILGGNAELLFGYDKHPERAPTGARLAGVAS